MLNGKMLRTFAWALLNDEYGINRDAWEMLVDMLADDGHEDIIKAVKATEGRFYLDENMAKELVF